VGSFSGDRPNTTFGSYAGLSYANANASAVAIDFNKIMIDVAFAGTTRNAGSYVNFNFMDVSANVVEATLTFTGSQLSASSLTIEFNKSQFALTEGTGPFDWNQVTTLGVGMSTAGATGAGQTWTATNFQMTAVPAPGALALLGVAGLAARRRRA
jgi:MYXO-CTERM domain-containing protein